MDDYTPELTPVEKHSEYWVKRDDLYCLAGIRGGKVRACWTLAQGATGLITASSRHSPQMQIVARIAERLGIPCRLHIPDAKGADTPEMKDALAHGGVLVGHRPGHNSVIISRARTDAQQTGWREIPFGMESEAARECTSPQAQSLLDLDPYPRRIVVPIGSGMTAAGILWGLLLERILNIPVIGIQVGANPRKRLNKYAPPYWETKLQIIDATERWLYGEHVAATITGPSGPILLDPIYEAKCLPYLKLGDLFWIVGIRAGLT